MSDSDLAVEAAAEHRPSRLHALEIAVALAVSAAMAAATHFGWWPITWMEVLGFITGGVCVWLTVREHLATWPIGLANNIVFLALFWEEELYADACLQIVYFAIGLYGWWNWLYGGARRGELTISRATPHELLWLLTFVPIATWGLREVLLAVGGAAPFWDALTTVLSLAAQFLMCRKRLEHWLFWMAADVVYVPLYVSRSLPLTAVLYFVFLLMCVAGLVHWQARWRRLRMREARPA